MPSGSALPDASSTWWWRNTSSPRCRIRKRRSTSSSACIKPGGEIILVNHIGAESGPRRLFEQCFAPLARRLGWRPEFPFGRLAAWAERHGGVRLIERRPMPPLGHFSLFRFARTAGDKANA